MIILKYKKITDEYYKIREKLLRKYDCRILIDELSIIYSKLERIHLSNDKLLENVTNYNEIIQDVSYTAKVTDIMSRKIKTLIEITIKRDNNKEDKILPNFIYKKFIILFYYYSIYIFYTSRSKLSKNYENGKTKLGINPNLINSILTYIPNINNFSEDEFIPRYNYNPHKILQINDEFDKTFLYERGITYSNFQKMLEYMRNNLSSKKMINEIIKKEKFIQKITERYNINLELFKKSCILSKNNIVDENNIYKNNSKYRLDLSPIVDIGEDFYFLNSGIIFNSENYWNNVCTIGLKPYTSNSKDKILDEVDKIINNTSKIFEKDIIKRLMEVNNKFDIKRNVKARTIFKDKKLDDNEWDVIAIDHNRKIIFDIEAKFMTTSMTESGLSNDLEKIVSNDARSYTNKFEKRIKIEKERLNDFLIFCNADNNYKIVHIMVTSKSVDLNVESDKRNFIITNYGNLKKYIINNYYEKSQ